MFPAVEPTRLLLVTEATRVELKKFQLGIFKPYGRLPPSLAIPTKQLSHDSLVRNYEVAITSCISISSTGTRSEAENNELDTPEDRYVRNRWQNLADQKITVYNIRSHIKATSAKINKAREDRDEAEHKFMSAARSVLTDLQNLFQEMQEKRETCRGYETSMETFEKELKHAQDELDHFERLLINGLRNPIEAGATREPLKLGIPPLPQSELLLCLKMEPARTNQYAEWRTLMHIVLEFNTAKQKLREHVQICCEMNIIPRYISLSEAQSWFPGDFSIDEDLKDLSETAAEWTGNTTVTKTTQFSVLLSNPASHLLREDFPRTAKAVLKKGKAALRKTKDSSAEHLQLQAVVDSAAKEVSIQNLLSDAKEGNKLDFINRWMLQTLRTSIHETETLYSQYLNTGPTGVLDRDEWQESVLSNWFDDEEASKTPPSIQSQASETTWETAPPTAPSWLSDPFSNFSLLYASDDEEEPMETEMAYSNGDLKMSHAAAEWQAAAPGPNGNDITLEMR
ncbi:hypothetical protein M406DRAFT_326077 [Cryphonectria parasitica EP155]|uniref:Uncharacterized protein n=1 Tax=Cryphonectria parasitica (strain ATCC 38755 / EP155) TaxID=660469 RepID=A0A9P4YD29_CRYP1|nr:uncharacterized protein M406DRAFT_326077 [Cryphonectria parasitica EP155]KAF3770652.1 hypothetical protein M406DRAFT_326077 [Cryphonectria parasitica EP155]